MTADTREVLWIIDSVRLYNVMRVNSRSDLSYVSASFEGP